MAFNLTLISYCGSLDMGLNVDAAAVEDPGLLRACTEDAFASDLAARRARRSAPHARAEQRLADRGQDGAASRGSAEPAVSGQPAAER